MIWLIALGIFVIIVMGIFITEVKHAPFVDEKEPFLWDDYDPKKDPTKKLKLEDEELHYAKTFCEHCKFFDGTAMCLNENNFGELSINLIKHCKSISLFEAK